MAEEFVGLEEEIFQKLAQSYHMFNCLNMAAHKGEETGGGCLFVR